jgi:mitochondrial inner membrane protease ATP23
MGAAKYLFYSCWIFLHLPASTIYNQLSFQGSTKMDSTSTDPLETKEILNVAPLPTPVKTDDAEASRLCNKWLESAVTTNTSIRFLLQTLIDSGCTPPSSFIRCVKCEQPQAGGFGMIVEELHGGNAAATASTNLSSTSVAKEQCQKSTQDILDQFRRANEGSSTLRLEPEIFVCQQYMENEHMVHKTVHHELIHAIDMCRTNMDPVRNCVHLACTEIRAENLSGECSFWKELPRMKSFKGHGQECVRRRALLSVRANPNCQARAADYVDAAMPRCFQDVYPYDRHPNQR